MHYNPLPNLFNLLALLLVFTLSLAGCGGSSSPANTDPTAPSAPSSGLNVTQGDQANKLTWNAVTGAESYNVYRSLNTGDGTSGTQVGAGITPPFYDKGLTNGTTYYYVVTSVNNVGESAASVELNATPFDTPIASLNFPDANLQACVNGTGLTYVHELKYLDCSSKSITDVTGMDALTSLKTMLFADNSISDVSPLAHLASVDKLELPGNSISDVSPLASMTILKYLYLNNNSVVDVSPLANLVNLQALDLNNNSIGGQGVGNVDQLSALTLLSTGYGVKLENNTGMSCDELSTLIIALGSPPVDLDTNVATVDTATAGVNCTAP